MVKLFMTNKQVLLEDGIISYDRNVPMISRHISNDISMDVRYRIIRNYIESTSFNIFILYASNEIELPERITKKSRISEYDSKAVDTNNKYIYIGNISNKRG